MYSGNFSVDIHPIVLTCTNNRWNSVPLTSHLCVRLGYLNLIPHISSKYCEKTKNGGGWLFLFFSHFLQKWNITRHGGELLTYWWLHDVHTPTSYLWMHINTTLWLSDASETDLDSKLWVFLMFQTVLFWCILGAARWICIRLCWCAIIKDGIWCIWHIIYGCNMAISIWFLTFHRNTAKKSKNGGWLFLFFSHFLQKWNKRYRHFTK